jgi:3-isopropylmalate/(R)-2-methylmalate dehydratase small subunit
MKESNLEGRIWVLLDAENRLIEDIDTDQIFHNAHLHITDVKEMSRYALGNLEGWKDFPQKVSPGDIVLAGRNFGAGSSRQQAVDCFVSLGVSALCAPSFGAIYFRNAVNSGFPALRFPDLRAMAEKGMLKSGDIICLDMEKGRGRIPERGAEFDFFPMSRVQEEIYRAGGLFRYGKSIG